MSSSSHKYFFHVQSKNKSVKKQRNFVFLTFFGKREKRPKFSFILFPIYVLATHPYLKVCPSLFPSVLPSFRPSILRFNPTDCPSSFLTIPPSVRPLSRPSDCVSRTFHVSFLSHFIKMSKLMKEDHCHDNCICTLVVFSLI